MIFSTFFEIGLLVLGFFYVANQVFGNIITLIDVSKDIEEKQKEEQEDKEREELCRHLYS